MGELAEAEMVTPDDSLVLLATLLDGGVKPALHRFLDLVEIGDGELSPVGSLWGLWLVSCSVRALAGDGETLLPADDGGMWALDVVDSAGGQLDIDRQDPRFVLLGRWMSAVLNQDAAQADALWWAAGAERCSQLLVDVFGLLRSLLQQLLDDQEDDRG